MPNLKIEEVCLSCIINIVDDYNNTCEIDEFEEWMQKSFQEIYETLV